MMSDEYGSMNLSVVTRRRTAKTGEEWPVTSIALTAKGWARACTFVLAFIVHHSSFITPILAQPLGQAELGTPLSTRTISPRFDHLTIDDGLSQGSVRDIHQDRLGFMWFTTQDGLNRWDGHQVKVYTHQPFDSTTISETALSHLDEDADGFLWVGTERAGLNRFDPIQETAVHFRHDPDDPSTLSSDEINDVLVAKDGMVWVATQKGLDRLDPDKDWEVTRYVHNPEDSSSISAEDVWRLFQDSNGTIWASTGHGFSRLNSQDEGRFTRFMMEQDPTNCSPNGTNRSGFAQMLERSEEPGVLWIGTTNGIVRFDTISEEGQRFVPAVETRCVPVASLTRDPVNPGIIWAPILDEGLARFDLRSESFSIYRHDPDNPTGLHIGRIFKVYTDRSGIVWVSSNVAGVSKFDPTSVGVAHYRSISGDPTSLRQPSVYGIFQSRDGIVWVGNVGKDGWAITALDRANNRATHYVHDPQDPTTRGPGQVYNIFEDSRGTIWAGSRRGLDRLDRRTGRFDHFAAEEGNPNSLRPGVVINFFEDQASNLWIGSFDGVSRMSLDRPGYFTRFDITVDPDDPFNAGSQSITEDLAGFIWVAMTEGLFRLDPKSGRVTSYLHDPANPEGIANPWVTHVHERSREPGIIWSTSSGGGISRLDVSTGKFRHYTVREGLANNNAYGFVEDDEGRFWISTNRGLSRFDPDTETFRNYGTDIGLQGLEFNSYGFHKGPYGELFFGGTNGLNSFFPNELSENNLAPEVTLVDLKLFNESVSKTGVVPINRSIAETDEIVLSHRQNDITLDFLAVHYADPSRNEYAYQLEGWNDDWVQIGQQRSASFTNLDPGSYTFRVKASNSDGVWNEEGASIRIVVQPPFWETLWFRFGALLAFGGLILGGYRFRVNQIATRARQLEGEVAARTAELKASNNQLEQSHTIVEAINQETSFSRLLTKILEEARVIPAIEKATALVLMPDGVFRVRASSGWDVNRMGHIELTPERAHARYVEQSTEVSKDVFVAREVSKRAGSAEMDEFGQVASFLVLRVRVEEETAGYLVFDNLTDSHAFDKQDAALLDRLREHIQSAFIKTRILEDLQSTLTNLQSTQDRLIQSEKMASLGQLTAGIAHEIKNPLNFVNNFSELTAEVAAEMADELKKRGGEMPADLAADLESLIDSLTKNAEKIAEHGKRADSIVQNMLEHSKAGEGERHATDLNDLLDEYVTLANHSYEARGDKFEVEFSRDFDTSIGKVDVVPQELGRVFMNLIGNALDALKEHGSPGGRPTVSVSTTQSDGWVEIRVADNGPGIPKKVQEKIFEPFFTTKPTGSGTGLGLSMSYDIVTKGHGGTLDVVSEEGQGATLIVRLPV